MMNSEPVACDLVFDFGISKLLTPLAMFVKLKGLAINRGCTPVAESDHTRLTSHQAGDHGHLCHCERSEAIPPLA